MSLAEECGFETEKTYPLYLDAYYVSLLSEQNRKSRFPMAQGFMVWMAIKSRRKTSEKLLFANLCFTKTKISASKRVL